MYRKLAFVTLGFMLALSFSASPILAHTVLEKVAKTGVLTAGTSKDAFPFAYKNEKGQLSGYSVDMVKLIQKQLEQELKRPITLKLVAVDPEDRISSLLTNKVDIVCDASSFTWERERDVDFSVSYDLTGTRLLVKRGSSLWGPESLVGKRIGALPKTTNELSMRRAQPKAQIVLVQDRAEGYKALQEGKIDAYASDGILLEGLLQIASNANKFQIVGYPYSNEGIGCMLPENNSTFRDTVNYTLIRFMQGFLTGKKSEVSTFDRWFGGSGVAPLTQDQRDLVIENMRLTLDSLEPLPESDL
ncbi:ABC transporter, substrate-binding protein (cluster 3, basic aa/glutamine/opines) [uncultured Coleofasciculus sp.]|uniref:ABC transporter, substrate-binding protein (Cluster 3, basic aa/glutamine/opines) n=1 Tax=uncultured Coleofasciculus sp. TaxID=1267456 RepID=A0A6J4JXR7_9CYAN|nr:ABC transporter, substrate-binding protein (cluster 3, basic aa/glutamine/opines) [uncultured Coleofasciculus sp.]